MFRLHKHFDTKFRYSNILCLNCIEVFAETKSFLNKFNIYSSKKVLHHSLLFLCILNFQYLWNLEKWFDQAQIFRECFLNPLLLIL